MQSPKSNGEIQHVVCLAQIQCHFITLDISLILFAAIATTLDGFITKYRFSWRWHRSHIKLASWLEVMQSGAKGSYYKLAECKTFTHPGPFVPETYRKKRRESAGTSQFKTEVCTVVNVDGCEIWRHFRSDTDYLKPLKVCTEGLKEELCASGVDRWRGSNQLQTK